jgi:glutamate-5-semialdehyde dehydrogenase
MEVFLQKAKSSSVVLTAMDTNKKNSLLLEMATALRENWLFIAEANQNDIDFAKESNLSIAMIDRLMLNQNRINSMATAIEEIVALKDPVGRVLDGWIAPNGLKIEKVAIPIGVVAIIYESRPNVTSDTAALCFKSGNVAILKGGKEAKNSNEAIAKVLQKVLINNNLPPELISLLPDSSREGVIKLIQYDRYLDLVIPRGGEHLIRTVVNNSKVPVIKHDKGVCHTYIDKQADFDQAIEIAINAKTHRTGVCNAMECLLIDKTIAYDILPILESQFLQKKTYLKGCSATREIIDCDVATTKDYYLEYLDNILNIRIVDGVDGAIEHIRTFGSGHSDAIVTQNYVTAEKFLNSIDSACVYLNASTRFTDGGEFGFGAEVGISTNKLHSRGPMGINDLTTYKYKIYGNGQIRV